MSEENNQVEEEISKDDVLNYLNNQKSEEGSNKPKPKELKKKIEIPKDETFEFKNDSIDNITTNPNAVDIKNIDVTEDEKEEFLKSILFDDNVFLEIPLFGGKLKLEVRSRFNFEQICIYDLVKESIDENAKLDNGKVDYPKFISYLHKYSILASLVKVNGKPFSPIDPDILISKYKEDKEEYKKVLRDNIHIFDEMSTNKWNTILNGLNIVEAKLSKLNSYAINEDFWNPVD